MPLHDHFHSPVMDEFPGDSLHSSWASEIAASLNTKWLVRPFRALEHRHVRPTGEIDVGTFETPSASAASSNGGAVATLPRTWTPTAPVATEVLAFPDSIEVRVFSGPSGWTLVGAIELISESNKDRPGDRDAFVSKCASYLHAGISVVLVDVVTCCHFNLHNMLLDRLRISGEARLPNEVHLYSTAYRPIQRGDRGEVDVWREACQIGMALPTMPLRLADDLFVPIELEATYLESCRKHWM